MYSTDIIITVLKLRIKAVTLLLGKILSPIFTVTSLSTSFIYFLYKHGTCLKQFIYLLCTKMGDIQMFPRSLLWHTCRPSPLQQVFSHVKSFSLMVTGTKAPVTHSRFWLRLITIRPDETYVVKSGCIGMVKTENSEIPTMSHDAPTVSLRLLYDS